MDVYWANIEYLYEKGSINYGRYAGGFVHAFVRAIDVRDAIKKFENDLNSLYLSIKRIDFVSIYEDIPWDTEKEQNLYDHLAEQASQTEDVVCDEFFAYEEE